MSKLPDVWDWDAIDTIETDRPEHALHVCCDACGRAVPVAPGKRVILVAHVDGWGNPCQGDEPQYDAVQKLDNWVLLNALV